MTKQHPILGSNFESGSTPTAGFTLVELLMAVTIMGVLSGFIVSAFGTMNRSFTREDKRAGVQQNLRVGIQLFARDLRLAGLDPLGTANSGVEEATATKIRFSADRNLNGTIDDSDNERITFAFDSLNRRLDQVLYEGSVASTQQTLIENVTDLTFTLRDEADAVTTDIADARSVVITLEIAESAGGSQTVRRSLATKVRCRNL